MKKYVLFVVQCLMVVNFYTPSAIAAKSQTQALSEQEITDIARDAYVYGLPLVSDYALMYSFAIDAHSSQFKAPFNQVFSMKKKLTPNDTSIPFPNNDTIYSTVWFDLRTEPMVLELPKIADQRYYSLVLTDGSSMNYGLVSSHEGNPLSKHRGRYLITGPNWHGVIPKNIDQVFHATTLFSLAIMRIQLMSDNDISNIDAIQKGIKVSSLSSFTHQVAPKPAAKIAFPAINRELAKKNFFGYLNFVLNLTPVLPEEANIRKKLASIGIGTGNPATFASTFMPLVANHKSALMRGVMAGEKQVQDKLQQVDHPINGWDWRQISLDSDRSQYHGDYLKRAAMFKFAPYGLNSYEAIYLISNKQADGELLDTGKHSYRLTFAANQLPPASAFWSLTVYDGKTRMFAANKIGRYLVNSLMLPNMLKNPDGSISIYIQKNSPGKKLAANWLPAPQQSIYLVLRIYGPELSVASGDWTMPAVSVIN